MAQADSIAKAVLEEFDRLPTNRKPAVRSNGIREWVPLSGIVAELADGQLVCVALATGMKCLPSSKLSKSKGVGIHDWHAEALALRAFNRFILQECRDVMLQGDESPFVRFRHDGNGTVKRGDGTDITYSGQLFEWRHDVVLHMYCSEAPCKITCLSKSGDTDTGQVTGSNIHTLLTPWEGGDASMELTMAAQEDASPWDAPITAEEDAPGSLGLLSGRGFFSRLGTVRRKPGRADAPPTLSKSCSDKLALRQCTTLLSGLATLLITPSTGLYLRSVVLPSSQYSETGCRRCFSAETDVGRLAPVAERIWPRPYAFVPFAVKTTDLEFAFSTRHPSMISTKNASSNLAVAWTLNGINECLVNGVLRGRKEFDPIGASAVSRRQMWKLAQQVATMVMDNAQGSDDTKRPEEKTLQRLFDCKTYNALKASPLLAARRAVKDDVKNLALMGWTPNENDGNWGLNTI
ncbi:tRNA-specific adenosine deaminase 1 [Sporothrix schenckii 1099-18]|uniref:tRNA-specific adenosine deaminase 1 n=1 Tax=Sporothrix schenckii 1099-18 TaxID=1397361 RepID=A0A0F2LYX8_SPOSC|nr:tRNA-specific adenosine deaminase 1 [Sporothrix schenckii 1099-18]KJR82668.1 tRNA-specific adenosine deaminase 1 [Sporothrix schenckii 1099-18]